MEILSETATVNNQDQNQFKDHILRLEKIIMSSLIHHPETRSWGCQNHLDKSIFLTSRHQDFIQAYNNMSEISNEPNIDLILDFLGGTDLKKRNGWAKYINDLKESHPPQNVDIVKHYVSRLYVADKILNYYKVAKNVMGKIKDFDFLNLDEKQLEVLNYIENAYFQIEQKQQQEKKEMTLAEGMKYAFSHTKKVESGAAKTTISLGYPSLNKPLNGGVTIGNFALIGGRPGMGKTCFMLNSALEVANEGVKTLFISIEMTLIQIFQRLLSRLSNINMGLLMTPNDLTRQDWDTLQETVDRIVNMDEDNMYFYETSKLSPNMLERIVKHYKSKYGVQSIYVDYAQIMSTNAGKPARDDKDAKEISNELMRIAKEHEVVLIVGSQLNRDSETRTDSRPKQSDIRGSGAFEQDAAVIIGLYRDEAYNKDQSEKPNVLECIFLKARAGEVTDVELHINLRKQLIAELGSVSASIAA